jgi:hypothetical protein
MNAHNKKELQALAAELLASRKPAKEEKPTPAQVNAAVHNQIVAYARIEESVNKAEGKRYPAFREMLSTALPLMADASQWSAIAVDMHMCMKARNLNSVGVQLVGVINNARKIAYGSPATNDKAAEPAQGCEIVTEAMGAATSIKVLKSALAALKVNKHASQGVSKAGAGAVASPAKPAKEASAPSIPASRAAAIQAAIKMLKGVTEFLKAGTDADLLIEIDDVCAQLLKRVA